MSGTGRVPTTKPESRAAVAPKGRRTDTDRRPAREHLHSDLTKLRDPSEAPPPVPVPTEGSSRPGKQQAAPDLTKPRNPPKAVVPLPVPKERASHPVKQHPTPDFTRPQDPSNAAPLPIPTERSSRLVKQHPDTNLTKLRDPSAGDFSSGSEDMNFFFRNNSSDKDTDPKWGDKVAATRKLEKQVTELEGLNKEESQQLKAAERECDMYKTRCKTKEQALAKLESANAQLQATNTDLGHQCKKTEGDVATLKAKLEKRVTELEGLNKEQSQQLKAAERECDMIKTIGKTQEQALAKLEAENAQLQATNTDLSHQCKKTEGAVATLKAGLESAHSQIFHLQPHKFDFTPDEAQSEFESLVYQIGTWVEKLMKRLLDSSIKMNGLAASGLYPDPVALQILRDAICYDNELLHACFVPDTEVEVISSLVMRWLRGFIFNVPLPGWQPQLELGKQLDMLQSSMGEHVHPKRAPFAVRNWRAEAYNAAYSHPDTQISQTGFASWLGSHIEHHLVILFRTHVDPRQLRTQLVDNIIKPAMTLNAKFQTSTTEYRVITKEYMLFRSDARLPGLGAETELDTLLRDLPTLKCPNLLQSRKLFNPEKMTPRPSKELVCRDLEAVLTVFPALMTRHYVQGKDVAGDPVQLCPQELLVSFGTSAEKRKFAQAEGRNVLSVLLDLQGAGNAW